MEKRKMAVKIRVQKKKRKKLTQSRFKPLTFSCALTTEPRFQKHFNGNLEFHFSPSGVIHLGFIRLMNLARYPSIMPTKFHQYPFNCLVMLGRTYIQTHTYKLLFYRLDICT